MEAEINCLTCAPKQRALNPPVFYGSLDLRATTLTIYRTGDPLTAISLVDDDAHAVLGLLASTQFSWDDPNADILELTYVGDGDDASFSELATDIDQYQASVARFAKGVSEGRIPNRMFNTLEARTFHLAPDVLDVFVYLRDLLSPLLAEGGASSTTSTLVALGDQVESFLLNADCGALCAVLECVPSVVPPVMVCIPCIPAGELI